MKRRLWVRSVALVNWFTCGWNKKELRYEAMSEPCYGRGLEGQIRTQMPYLGWINVNNDPNKDRLCCENTKNNEIRAFKLYGGGVLKMLLFS